MRVFFTARLHDASNRDHLLVISSDPLGLIISGDFPYPWIGRPERGQQLGFRRWRFNPTPCAAVP